MSLRRKLMDEVVAFEKDRAMWTVPPRVVVLGFEFYDALKAEVLACVAEVVPTQPCNAFLIDLNKYGIECFYWSGMVVCRSKHPQGGPIFL